jgi:hypothetical protein
VTQAGTQAGADYDYRSWGGYDASFDRYLEEQEFERAWRESLETAPRYRHVPRTPASWFTDDADAGPSYSQPPPPVTQTQPEETPDPIPGPIRPVPRRHRGTEVSPDRPLQRARRAPDRYSDSRYHGP